MANNTADGTGATFSFSGVAGDIVSINYSGMSRAAIDATHLGSLLVKEYIAASLYDGGEVSIEMNVQSGSHLAMLTTYVAIGSALVITIDNQAGAAVTFTTTAICTAVDPFSVSEGTAIKASATFKIISAVTIS